MNFSFIKIFLFSILLVFFNCALFPKKEVVQFPNSKFFFWKGYERTYEIFIPKKKVEFLIIALHGRGGTGKEFFFKSEMYNLAEREGIILLLPDGENKSWTDGRKLSTDNEKLDDSGFILALGKKYAEEFQIPKKNLILVGYSNGGYLTEKISFESNFFYSYTTIVSTISLNLSKQNPKFPQNIMLINGTEDPVVSFNGGEVLGGKGKILSVDESINIWKKRNASNEFESKELEDKYDDGVKAVEMIYRSSKTKKTVKLIKLIGAGHGYPGKIESDINFGRFTKEISANDEIWNFFLSLKKAN